MEGPERCRFGPSVVIIEMEPGDLPIIEYEPQTTETHQQKNRKAKNP
jgi:hypothetical protein